MATRSTPARNNTARAVKKPRRTATAPTPAEVRLTASVPPPAPRLLRPSDFRGIAMLATQATHGVTRIAEGVQQAVWRSLGAPAGKEPGQTRGITSLVYKAVHGVTALVGRGADSVLTALQPLLTRADAAEPQSPQREAVLAALNGVLGDHLHATGNPLATPMQLFYLGRPLDWRKPPHLPPNSGKLLVMLHGLCMNDLQWTTQPGPPPVPTSADETETLAAPPNLGSVAVGSPPPPGMSKGASSGAPTSAAPGAAEQTGSPGNSSAPVDHGAALAASLGYTVIQVRYNTGLHTSQNGHELAEQLEQLVMHWPVRITHIAMLVHSMGGLVIRSAFHTASEAQRTWPRYVKRMVFLGTPHHGAPLEKAGNWIDVILGITPYTKPFAKLGQLRSAGITDLRFGHVLDADWQGHDRFERKPDSRTHLPLPAGVACYAVAATIATQRSLLAERLTGDGLVPLHSALGQHDDPARRLVFPKSNQFIAYRTNHMQLLSSPQVGQQVLAWLSSPAR